jgi:DNA-binding FadR family transcriptional regulator
MACARRTEEDLEHMRAILKESEECIRAGQGIERQDWDFHIAMVAAARNDIFVRVVNTFYFLSWARRQVYFSDIKRSRHSNAQHKKIFRAIEAQDVPAAIALMQQHLGQVERDWQIELKKKSIQS